MIIKVENAQILEDEKYVQCIQLAMKSKNDRRNDEKYGSILVKNSQIIGQGYNRAIVHPTFRLNRIIRQGYANHAEIEALNNALENGFNVEGGDIYVAGYFSASGQLFLQQVYTCKRCLPYLKKWGISNIHIPTQESWKRKSLEIAIEEAEKYALETYKKRKQAILGNLNIEIIKKLF